MLCSVPPAFPAADRAAATDTDTGAPSGEGITTIITTTDRVPVRAPAPDREARVQAVLEEDTPADSAAAEAAGSVDLVAVEAGAPAEDGAEITHEVFKTRVCVHGHRPFL